MKALAVLESEMHATIARAKAEIGAIRQRTADESRAETAQERADIDGLLREASNAKTHLDRAGATTRSAPRCWRSMRAPRSHMRSPPRQGDSSARAESRRAVHRDVQPLVEGDARDAPATVRILDGVAVCGALRRDAHRGCRDLVVADLFAPGTVAAALRACDRQLGLNVAQEERQIA
jgi:hypothetical protein